jgi:hypothetical protein
VVKVAALELALALDLLVRAPQPADRLGPPMAATRAPGNMALRLRQPPLSCAVVAWIVDGAARSGDEKHAQPHVDARFTSGRRQRLNGSMGTSAHEKQAMHAYQPSASRLIVTVLGAPTSARCSRIGIRPSVERLSIPPSSTAPVP